MSFCHRLARPLAEGNRTTAAQTEIGPSAALDHANVRRSVLAGSSTRGTPSGQNSVWPPLDRYIMRDSIRSSPTIRQRRAIWLRLNVTVLTQVIQAERRCNAGDMIFYAMPWNRRALKLISLSNGTSTIKTRTSVQSLIWISANSDDDCMQCLTRLIFAAR
jgi:hypothetical protein